MEYIDLSLPSGTLWASENESEYYTFNKAILKYKFNLPSKEDWQELMEHTLHYWDRDSLGIKFIGKNGNEIFLPAAGFSYEIKFGVCILGEYWSSSRYNSIDNAYFALFSSSITSYKGVCDRSRLLSVRLIKGWEYAESWKPG